MIPRALLVLAALEAVVGTLIVIGTGGVDLGPLHMRSASNPTTVALVLCVLATLLGAAPPRALDDKRLGGLLGAAAAVVLTGVKLQQHHVFQTSAYDLGMYASTAWNTAHGRPFYDSVMNIVYLSDHFAPFFMLLAPLLWTGADAAATLLVLQSAGIGLAAVAVHRIARRRMEPPWALAATALFLVNPYLHRIIVFDFHPVALAIPILLWLLDFAERGRALGAAILALLALTLEETVAPPLVGVGLYMLCCMPAMRGLGAAIALGATALFGAELKWWIPMFLGHPGHMHMARYADLGGSLSEIAGSLLRDPLLVLRTLGTPPAKLGAAAGFFASLGFLPLLAPATWIMLGIPLLILMLSSAECQWSFSYHYPAVLWPPAFYAALHGLGAAVRRVPARALACAVLGLLSLDLARVPTYVDPASPAHVAAAHRLLRAIPPGTRVCATHCFVPHLVSGRDAYVPHDCPLERRLHLEDADYVLLEEQVDARLAYPMAPDAYARMLGSLAPSSAVLPREDADRAYWGGIYRDRPPRFTVLRREDGIVLLKR